MSTIEIATACSEDLEAKLQTVDVFKKKIMRVYTEKDMLDVASQIQMPCAGIIYEGMRSVPDADKTNKGLSVELVFSVMLIVSGKSIGNPDFKTLAATYLDQFRNAIKSTRAPGGNFWKFNMEAAVEEMKGGYVYQQRWSTPALLTA